MILTTESFETAIGSARYEHNTSTNDTWMYIQPYSPIEFINVTFTIVKSNYGKIKGV